MLINKLIKYFFCTKLYYFKNNLIKKIFLILI